MPLSQSAYIPDGELFHFSLDELVAFETRPATRKKRQRQSLPYGMWVCADGREVLFNRDYRPIWQRMPGMSAERADVTEWISWITQLFLYDDYDAPWQHSSGIAVTKATRVRIDRTLSDFLIGESLTDDIKRWSYPSSRKVKGLRHGSMIDGVSIS